MPSSRTVMIADGQPPERVVGDERDMAPSTRTLSASGSRNAPERVVPWRRAMVPVDPVGDAERDPERERPTHEAPSSTTIASSGTVSSEADDREERWPGWRGPTGPNWLAVHSVTPPARRP